MISTTFDAFLDEERAVAPPPAVDWAARKARWFQALEDFLHPREWVFAALHRPGQAQPDL